MKKAYGFNPEEHFVVSEQVRAFFADIPERGQELVRNWESLVKDYDVKYPEEGAEFRQRVDGRLPENWKDLIPSSFPNSATATRKSSGLVFNPIAEKVKNFMVGTADLSPSVNMIWKDKIDFQNVSRLRLTTYSSEILTRDSLT